MLTIVNRNMLMSSNLMASTSMLIVVLLFNVLVSDNSQNLFSIIKVFGSESKVLLDVKILIIVSVYFMVFISHAISMRYITHVGFVVNASIDERSTHFAIHQLLRGGRHFTIGQRCIYLTIPLLLWLFDPLYMVIAVLLLIFLLYQLDGHFDFEVTSREVADLENITTQAEVHNHNARES